MRTRTNNDWTRIAEDRKSRRITWAVGELGEPRVWRGEATSWKEAWEAVRKAKQEREEET